MLKKTFNASSPVTNVSDHTINYDRTTTIMKARNYSYGTCLSRWWEKLCYRGEDCSKNWCNSKILSRSIIINLHLFASYKAEQNLNSKCDIILYVRVCSLTALSAIKNFGIFEIINNFLSKSKNECQGIGCKSDRSWSV